MEEELGAKIIKEFAELRAKTYSYIINGGSEDNKAKGKKKSTIKQKFKFEDHKKLFRSNSI